jgi:uncharacterized membrane protein YfcA
MMAASGVLASPVGLWLAHRVPNGPLTVLFAIVLGWVAVRMFRQSRAPQSVASAASTAMLPQDHYHPANSMTRRVASSGRHLAHARWRRRVSARAFSPVCWA